MDLKLVQKFLPYAAIAIITTLSLWSRRSRRCRSNDSDDEEAEVSSPPLVKEDGFQYDVFLSFRGSDTRKTFADLLYQALKDKGITTFIDSKKLEKGQKLEVLLDYIQRSKIFVPIFSPGYADSEWCLKEIAQMVECKRLILPVFVDVEPRDVRNQTGPFRSAFSKHRKDKAISEVEVSKWSDALKEAGGASGYTLGNTHGYLGKLIQQIVKRILSEVNKTSKLVVAQHPVGLNSRILDVMKMLESEAQDDVRMVGICGMGGIGKTTLSKAVYNEISSRFDARSFICSFISNVREEAGRPSGLVSLQKRLLGDVFNDNDVTISNTSDGLGQIEKRIGAKKVLLVLDDVDDVSQINELVGQLAWFRSGSRIIITTRDKRVLTLAKVKENHVYELKGLDDIQSLQLFSWHAFGKKQPDAKFADLSNQVASTAAGLPLALTIFGSHFFDLKTVEDWRDMLKRIKENLDKNIFERLRISFDVLDDNEKEVFLDIACFFVGDETKRPTLMWQACGFSPKIAIPWLIHKSLVSINDEGEFEMHDHVRDMARKIVHAKAKEAGKHSRLWKNDESVDVLQNKRGTEDVEAITLSRVRKEGSVYVDVEHLAAMSQLRMLLLQGVTLKGGYEHFPRKLRWLEWSPQALERLPSSLHLEMIAVLDLSDSSITQVCDPQKMTVKVFDQLKVLDLSGCWNLSICPDFASMMHLEMLSFHGCTKISELHPSIGLLKCLTHLSLGDCSSLKELPQEVWQLTKLEEFDLCNCFKITTLPSLKQHLLGELKVLKLNGCCNLTMCPDFMGMPHLEILDFEGCKKMSELHPSIGHLKSLTNLNLSFCTSLKQLPQEVWQLTSLQVLNLSHCRQITSLPSQIQNSESLKLLLLERLDLTYCSDLIMCPDFTSMPQLQELHLEGCKKMTQLDPSIWQLKRLAHLNLGNCKSLELPQEIGQLTSLKELKLGGCSSLKDVPQEIWQLTSLRELDFSGCKITALPSHIRNVESLKLPLLETLNLAACSDLMTCPVFTSMPHLQRLSFSGCRKITKLDPSIGQLKRLWRLNLQGCESLKGLPQEIGQLTSLTWLTLMDCSSLKEVPPLPPSLKELHASRCNQLESVADVSNLKGLQLLGLSGCGRLEDIPGIEQLTCLKRLCLGGCRRLPDSLLERVQGLDLLEALELCNWENLTKRPAFTSLLNWLSNLKHLRELDLSWTDIEELPALTSSVEELRELKLTGCIKLVHIHGVQQLKRLLKLQLAGCRSLHDSFFERLQAANIRNLRWLSIPGRLINERSTDPQSITFILPKQFHSGLLCLYVDQRSLDHICSELEKNNGDSSEDEVTRPIDRQLGRSVIRVDITTDDAQFSFTTFINGWGERRKFPMATFARDSELMMMARKWRLALQRRLIAKQRNFKGNDVDDAQERGMMEMRVSIDGCVLLHGDLSINESRATDKDLDPCRVSDNIVQVKFEG